MRIPRSIAKRLPCKWCGKIVKNRKYSSVRKICTQCARGQIYDESIGGYRLLRNGDEPYHNMISNIFHPKFIMAVIISRSVLKFE